MNSTARPSPGPYRLLCLGPGVVLRPDGERILLRTRKHLALLLILALRRGRPVTRDRLIELLWSEDGEKKARHSLSQSVSLVNKALGADLITAAGVNQLAINTEALAVDLTEFEDLASDGKGAEARALWKGTVLDGLWLRRAPAFERWIADERARVERVMRRLATELIEQCRQAGDHLGMRAEAEALLVLDPLDESAMLACLQALALCNERTLALRRFAEFEARLKAELDAEPGAQLRSWVRRYRKNELPASSPAPVSRVHEIQSLPAVQPLFGRVEEYKQLWDAWERAQTGTGSFWIIEGEPGIGKTALVGKLANQVHVSGASVCFVKCYRTEKSVPFAPISALIRQLARLPGFMAMNPTWIGELTRLVPELRDRFPHAPPPLGVDDSARFRLCDAAVHAAECVADEQPLLIVVDDIHDADEATLALLHYLGRQVGSRGAVLVTTARSGHERSDLERTFFESALSTGLSGNHLLSRLENAAIAKLVAQVLAARGAGCPAELVDAIVVAANGNPLVAIEASLAPQPPSGPGAQSPGSLEDACVDRLQDLPSSARALASALALAGRPLEMLDLGEVAGVDGDGLMKALGELQRSSFVRRTESGIEFTHDEYQAAAESCTPDFMRARLHSRLAQLLVRQHVAVTQAPIEVARHLALSGSTRHALQHALAASHYAKSLGAVRERANALELACSLSERDPRQLVELADCYLDLKEFDSVRRACLEVETRVPPVSTFALECRYLRIAADYQSGVRSLSETRESLAQLLTSDSSFPHSLPALLQLLRLADKCGDRSDARRIARVLRAAAEPADSNRKRGYRSLAAGFIISKYYWPVRAIAPLREALSEAQAARDWELELTCRDGLGAVLKQVGLFADSVEQIKHGLEFARKTLNPQAEAAYLSNLAVSEIALGHLDQASDHLRRAEAMDAAFPRWPLRAYRMSNQGVLLYHQGLHAEAVAKLEDALLFASAHGLWATELACRGMLAMCAVRQGDTAQLIKYCEEVLGGTRAQLANVPDRGPTEAALAWYHARKGNSEVGLSGLADACTQLRRRDADHWMFAELERIRLIESTTGLRAILERTHLYEQAREFGASLFSGAALEPTQPVLPG